MRGYSIDIIIKKFSCGILSIMASSFICKYFYRVFIGRNWV